MAFVKTVAASSAAAHAGRGVVVEVVGKNAQSPLQSVFFSSMTYYEFAL